MATSCQLRMTASSKVTPPIASRGYPGIPRSRVQGFGRFEEALRASHGHRSLVEPFTAIAATVFPGRFCRVSIADLVTECEPKPGCSRVLGQPGSHELGWPLHLLRLADYSLLMLKPIFNFVLGSLPRDPPGGRVPRTKLKICFSKSWL